MKAKGVSKGLKELPAECGKCGSTAKVRWIALANSHYTFSGYLCEVCEPTTGPTPKTIKTRSVYMGDKLPAWM